MAGVSESYYEYGNINQNTWWIADRWENCCYLAEGEERALLIDAGIGMPGLKECIDRITKLPVTVVLTHGHLDHIGGCGNWKDIRLHVKDGNVAKIHAGGEYRACIPGLMREIGIRISQEAVNECINMKQPSEIADLKEEPIILGRRRFDVIHTPGHTKGSVCLLDRENNLLFSGDTVCGRRVMLSFEESETGDVFKESIKRLTEVTNADTEIYCGHSRRPLKKEVLN